MLYSTVNTIQYNTVEAIVPVCVILLATLALFGSVWLKSSEIKLEVPNPAHFYYYILTI